MSALRRLLLVGGVAAFVFGWGLTHWAVARVEHSGEHGWWIWWTGETPEGFKVLPSDTMMEYGIELMAIGAAATVFGMTRSRAARTAPGDAE